VLPFLLETSLLPPPFGKKTVLKVGARPQWTIQNKLFLFIVYTSYSAKLKIVSMAFSM